MAEERQTEMRPSPALDTAAKVIRVATVPPLMVAALLLILRARLGADFADMTDLGIGWTGLVLLAACCGALIRNAERRRSVQSGLAQIALANDPYALCCAVHDAGTRARTQYSKEAAQ